MLDLALQRLEPAPVLGMPAGLALVSAWIGERVPGGREARVRRAVTWLALGYAAAGS